MGNDDLLAPVTRHPRESGISDDGHEPGANIDDLGLLERCERADAGLLGHIFRIGSIAGQPARQAISVIEKRHDPLGEQSPRRFACHLCSALPRITCGFGQF